MTEMPLPPATLVSESSEKPLAVIYRLQTPDDATEQEKREIEEVNAMLFGYHKMGTLLHSWRAHPLENEVNESTPDHLNKLKETFTDIPRIVVSSDGTLQREANFSSLLKTMGWVNARLPSIVNEDPQLDYYNLDELIKVLLIKIDYDDPQEIPEPNKDLRILKNLKEYTSADPNTRAHAIARVRQIALTHLQQPDDNQFRIEDIPYDDTSIAIMRKKFSQIRHDLGNPLSGVSGFLLHPTEAFPTGVQGKLQFVSSALSSLIETYDGLEKLLQDEYEKKPMTLEQILACINDATAAEAEYKQLHLQISGEESTRNQQVLWSPAWIKALSQNILNNAFEAQATTLQVGSSTEIIEGKEFLCIVFDNNGAEIPQKIIQNGFQHKLTDKQGLTQRQGNGIGMALHRETIEEQYGGQLIPENIFDETGNFIAARITVKLPTAQ